MSTGANRDHLDEATRLAAKLKHGSYDSVQALALLSIAESLAVLAERSTTT
ncbi:hypothetical protein GCM10027596_37830 [Nocardioides korecus]